MDLRMRCSIALLGFAMLLVALAPDARAKNGPPPDFQSTISNMVIYTQPVASASPTCDCQNCQDPFCAENKDCKCQEAAVDKAGGCGGGSGSSSFMIVPQQSLVLPASAHGPGMAMMDSRTTVAEIQLAPQMYSGGGMMMSGGYGSGSGSCGSGGCGMSSGRKGLFGRMRR